MSNRTLRMFLCAIVVAVFGALGPSARATAFYDVTFDPEFSGPVRFGIDEACLAQTDDIYDSTGICQLDLIFAHIFDSAGGEWLRGFLADVGLSVQIVGNELVALSTQSIFLFFVTQTDDQNCPEVGTLKFSLEGGASFLGCAGPTADTASYTLVRVAVPEPGTLALILGALGAGWLTRRRKVAA